MPPVALREAPKEPLQYLFCGAKYCVGRTIVDVMDGRAVSACGVSGCSEPAPVIRRFQVRSGTGSTWSDVAICATHYLASEARAPEGFVLEYLSAGPSLRRPAQTYPPSDAGDAVKASLKARHTMLAGGAFDAVIRLAHRFERSRKIQGA